MAATLPSPFPFPPKRLYSGAKIPMRVIRRYARAIAERFHPDKIILFGSYAYGKPHEDSDVDLLVIMPVKNERSAAVRILQAINYTYPLDLLVRTPTTMRQRVKEGDWFLRDVVEHGK